MTIDRASMRVEPAATPDELAAILAALSFAAPADAANDVERPSRWRAAGRRYDAYDAAGERGARDWS